MRPFRVNAYMKAIPPGNKNPEKPQLLHNFIEGVCRVGDKGSIIDTYQYEPADVGVLQGFVHPESKHVPHLNLRRSVLSNQASHGGRTIIADSNLFLAYDPKNTKTYLRYSFDGIFPTTGEYCDNKLIPERWGKLRDTLDLRLKPYRKNGDYILITCQRDGGWSMDGQELINWLHVLLQRIARHTDRKVLVRFHPGDKKIQKHIMKLRAIGHKVDISTPTRTLMQDLMNAYCVVSYNSSPAVVSAIEGVPIFVLDPERSQAKEVANTNLRDLENPNYEFDREAWLRRLSMFHWTQEELKTGECWKHMRDYAWKK